MFDRLVTAGLRASARMAVAALVIVAGAAVGQDGSSAWFDGGRPGAQAKQAVALLADAASHGLHPQDYGVEALRRAVEEADRAPRLAPQPAAALRMALDAAMQRYLRDLHQGRVLPSQTGHAYKPAAVSGTFDPAAVLQDALARRDLDGAARTAAPALSQYERLREALQAHRGLVDHPAWQQPLPPLPGSGSARKLEPGGDWAGVGLLADRLTALGDLPSQGTLPPPAQRYAGPLVEAVRAFQLRHGLEADGVIGRATRAALEVTPAQRARQIELALERLRWTPLRSAARMIVVNIPEFVLRAYEVDGPRVAVRVESRVIVGKALDTRTPLIQEDLRHIEFQPFWNVPASIARNELVPRLRREPGYWAREGFEFVGPAGAPADPVLSSAKLDAVMAGALRIRQRPGPRNALGDIKFVFPNRESIYLHHTPSVGLFAQSRRDFSHGCVRVEQPLALAVFALQGPAGWDRARVERAMTQDEPSTVRLAQPIPVVIAYGTALVRQQRVHFYEDLYGHDRVLDAALRRPREPAFPSHLLTP